MEFQNTILRLDGALAEHIDQQLTPRTGATKAREHIFGELDDALDRDTPPRWILLELDDQTRLAHIAHPFFVVEVTDADELFEDADEFLYLEGEDAYLFDGEDHHDVDRPNTPEIEAYVCANGMALTEFAWFEDVPDIAVFVMMMEDAEEMLR